jgi:branched-chain amino acid transport system substrate-binding protein
MLSKYISKGFTRRTFLKTSAAATAALGLPKVALAAGEPIKIGFLAPLTGAVAAWGKPGLDGCMIWAERVNAAGGIMLADGPHPVEFVAYDEEYDPAKARTGATKLIREDGVSFIMMLGGDPWPGVQPVAERTGMLFSTLLPSDLSPDTKTLLAPAEVHPIYNVTGVEWLAQNKPELKTAVMCAQDDALGLPSVATYLAAFEAAGIEMLDEPLLFDPATTDFAPVVTRLMAKNPDIICLDTCYSDYVHPIAEQLFQQNFKGQIISCTADFYDQMIAKTSKEFMEGFIFQFPDFDDPALNAENVNFQDPNGFYAEYNTASRSVGRGELGICLDHGPVEGCGRKGRLCRPRSGAGRDEGRPRQPCLWRGGMVGRGALWYRQRAGGRLARGRHRERQGRDQGIPFDPRLV